MILSNVVLVIPKINLIIYFTSSGVQRTPSNRSTASTVSSLLSFEPIPDEDLTESPTEDLQNGPVDENRYNNMRFTCFVIHMFCDSNVF